MSGIGSRLRTFANQMGGITKLAESLGISQPRLSQYVSEARDLNTEILADLARLGCDLNWLVGDSSNVSVTENNTIKLLQEKNRELQRELDELKKSFDSAYSTLSKVADKKVAYGRKKN